MLFGFASFAVDFGRVQVAKSQLRASADAASRHAAMLLPSGASVAVAGAIDAADDNKVDGSPLILKAAQDIEVGYWNTGTRKFTALTGSAMANANAIRVVAKRTAARGTPVPMIFARLLGRDSCDVTAESISMLRPPTVIDTDVPATASPYLAGMPYGTLSSLNNPHNSPDRAGFQSPPQIQGLGLKGGESLVFDNIAGGANNDLRWSDRFMPDGNLGWMTRNDTATNSGELGKSDMWAPINALVGVFLTDADPRDGTVPQALDFRDASKRDFAELKPQIAQVFFIGDGKTSDGRAQRFVAPLGATRFFLANWDGYEWNNNVGLRTTRTTRLGSVITVK
ncbi:MAG: hypothetical protein H7144_16905 [Burkholderiales bacterium]|nr:hypothetical protein [Phycisphaerae bacterium]